MSTERVVLSPDELMRLLGLGRATIYEALRRGTIPSVRIGKRYLIAKQALAALLACGAPQAGPKDGEG